MLSPGVLAYGARRLTPSDIWEHLPFLHDTALSYERPKIIELGVRTGNSTSALLAAAEEGGGHLWSVDIIVPPVPVAWLDDEAWTFLHGSDVHPEIVRRIKEDTAPGVDVLFIDSSHEYEHTLEELRTYVPMVRPGGVVLMHDTEATEQPPFANEGARKIAENVTRAIEAYCAEMGLTWESRHGCGGLGVINIPEAADAVQP